MDTTILEHVNAMPAPTWHWLRMNETTVEVPTGTGVAHAATLEVPQGARGTADAFERALAQAQIEWEALHPASAANDSGKAADALDETARSSYQFRADAIEAARSLEAAFECGMGESAWNFMRSAAEEPLVIEAKPGESVQASVRVSGIDGTANLAAIDVVAAEDSEVELVIAVDSPETGTGLTGSSVRVFAGRSSQVRVLRTQTLDDTWIDLDDMGLFTAEGARIDVRQTVLGAEKSYTGLAGDLRGDSSQVGVDVRYLGRAQQLRDFSYTLRHHGQKTECAIGANGVLAGTSKKTLRGTIDLIRGCKGASGQENETVLLVDEGVENKTVPVILCSEDDVAGNHGATIGHVRPEQMFYLASRGLTQEAAERMFVSAMLEQAALDAPDAASRAGVERLAARIGIPLPASDTEEA